LLTRITELLAQLRFAHLSFLLHPLSILSGGGCLQVRFNDFLLEFGFTLPGIFAEHADLLVRFG